MLFINGKVPTKTYIQTLGSNFQLATITTALFLLQCIPANKTGKKEAASCLLPHPLSRPSASRVHAAFVLQHIPDPTSPLTAKKIMTLIINVELSKSDSNTCILQTAAIPPNTKEVILWYISVSHYKHSLQTAVLEIGIPKLQ